MAEYRVTAPDGSTYNVTGPDGATDAQVLAQVKAYKPAGDAQAKPSAATPSAAAASPSATEKPLPAPVSAPDQSMTGFVLGNLNKGIANLAGTPVDAITNALNLGIAGAGVAGNKLFGMTPPNPIDRPVGGSEWIQNLMTKGGMIGPSAEPQSGPQRYAAAALQFAPSAALGRPGLRQVPRALTATTSSAVGSEAARDIGGDEWASVGAMLPGARGMREKPAGERATAARQAERFGTARELGIPVPPSALKADKAQQAIQNQGNKALRQPEGTEFSPQTLRAYQAAAYGDYENVIKAPALAKGVMPTPKFQQEIQAIGNEIEAARTSLPETFKGMKPVVKLLGEYGYAALPPGAQQGSINIPPRSQPIAPEVAMRAVKKLRSDATTNFSSDSPEKVEMARVQKRLANALEDMIEENLARTGDQALMDSFRQARTSIARSHDYQAAMEPGGRINAQKLAAMQNEGSPLSGGTEKIASVAGEFPAAVGKPKSDETFTKKVSPMAVTHPPAVVAHQVPRFWERGLMTGPGQAMIDPRNQLTPEQQRMVRFMSVINAQNRARQIPTPPE